MKKKRAPVVLNLTKVAALKPAKKPYRVADIGRRGFVVVVYPSGKKSYQYRYKISGAQKIVHLGDYPDTDLADAHALYQNLRKLVRQGVDPKRPTEKPDTGPTFAEVAEEWYHRHCLAKVRNSAGQWINHPRQKPLRAPKFKRAQLDKHLLPFWKDRPFREITRLDANRRLDEIVADKAPVMANRVSATIIQIWTWALDEGIIDASPMHKLGKRGGKEAARERTLNDDEIRTFWSKLPTSGLSDDTANALRLILLTATRRSEAAGAKWSEIDGDVWTIPPARTKTGGATDQPHVVPLSKMALELVEEIRKHRDESDPNARTYLFPSAKGGPVRSTVLTRALDRKTAHFGIGKFTPHDLRRTVRTKLSELGVDPVVSKKVLNHKLQGMDAIYDRHEYLDEKRDALQKWADRLTRILNAQ